MFLLTDAAREAIVHPRCGALRAGYIRAAAALHRCPAEAAPMLPGFYLLHSDIMQGIVCAHCTSASYNI